MQQEDAAQVYEMTVDLNVLDHLGINLYSNIAAVLTEAVANAWDADAENVAININSDPIQIEIVDDGVGMTVDDMNKKYLRVGYRRRDDAEHGKFTAKERPVMGRKGLGKLSLFSIADTIEVHSAKNGKAHGLSMCAKGIRKSAEEGKDVYKPHPLPPDKILVAKGTRIVLKDVKRERIGRGTTALRKRLARRFSVIGEKHGFKVAINGMPVTIEDRGDLSMVQFLWTFGGTGPENSSTPKVQERAVLSDEIEISSNVCRVRGWIGTACQPKQLDNNDAGNLNSIVVFARGRLFHENLLDKINDGRFYTKYLTGQIEADFLDEDDKPDIATSDRQRVKEDDERYMALLDFLKSRFTEIEKQWTEWRRKHEVKRVQDTSPGLKMWLEVLPKGIKKNAERLIGKLSALPIDNDEDRKLLYRHGVLAFERMRVRGATEELTVGVHEVDKLLEILAGRDALEASLYCDITKSRLEVIEKFRKIIDNDAKERVIQKYLFDHLWLLDPAWERATGSEAMESRLKDKGVIIDGLSEKEALARVDIAYRTSAGKHIIIELKRASRRVKLLELVGQGQTYVDKLGTILQAQGESDPNIEVVFVLGKPLNEEKENPDRFKSSMNAVSPGSRVVCYDSLIKGAEKAYSEYLERNTALDRIDEIVNQI